MKPKFGQISAFPDRLRDSAQKLAWIHGRNASAYFRIGSGGEGLGNPELSSSPASIVTELSNPAHAAALASGPSANLRFATCWSTWEIPVSDLAEKPQRDIAQPIRNCMIEANQINKVRPLRVRLARCDSFARLDLRGERPGTWRGYLNLQEMKSVTITQASCLIGLFLAGICQASTDATCLVYQPIDMKSEGTVIRLPEYGFIILAVPYSNAFSIPEKPYDAITKPYKMLSMRRTDGDWDSNLVSRTGISIQSNCTFDGDKLKEELVTVDLWNFRSTDYEPSQEVIVEAALECIRRTATDEHQEWHRPMVKIIGKPADDARWKLWSDAFNKQDFSKPFKRPQAAQKDAEALTPNGP